MKKNMFILVLSLLMLLLVSGCGNDESGSGESSEETITLGHANPADSDISHYQQFAEKFKDEIEESTDGEISVEIHPGSELGGEREMLESIEIGDLDSIVTATAPLGNFASSANVFDFPFLFRDVEHVHNALDGDAITEVEEDLEDANFKVLAWNDGGFGAITNDVKPIESVDDISGMKIRTMENDIQIDTFEAFGANATPMSFDELFTGLQQGVVDGQFNPLATIAPNKFYEVQDYMTMTDHYYLAAPFIISSDKFNSFSEEQQEKVEKAAVSARDHERDFVEDQEEKQLETVKDEGMEVITNDEIDIDEFKKAVEPVYEKHDDEFKEIIDKIKDVD